MGAYLFGKEVPDRGSDLEREEWLRQLFEAVEGDGVVKN